MKRASDWLSDQLMKRDKGVDFSERTDLTDDAPAADSIVLVYMTLIFFDKVVHNNIPLL